MPDTPQTAGLEMRLSESAARRILALASSEKAGNAMLRISVSGGGCSGFKYGFTFDDRINFDDKVFERDGARIVVDEVSLELLAGSELDFVEEMVGSYFAVKNPNAKSSCGCGTSFSVA